MSARHKIKLPGIPANRVFAETAPSVADVLRAVTAMNETFSAFKAKNDEAIKELRNGRDDVVTREHVDRINADVGKMATGLEDMQRQMAALAVNGGAGNDNDPAKTPEARAHRKAFDAFFRKGIEAGLKELEIKAALSSDSNPDGGFTVPREYDYAVTRVLTTLSVMRNLARVMTIGGGGYNTLHNLGGSGSGWVGETEARSATSTPTLVPQEFIPMEMYANPAATQTVIDDAAFDIEAWLAAEVNIKFAETEGAAWVNGTGVKQPRGFLSYTTVANGSYSTSSTANWAKIGYVPSGASGAFVTPSTSVSGYDKLLDLYHALRPQFRGNAAFLSNDLTLAEVRKIKTGGDGQYVYMPPTATEPGSVLGKPWAVDENMPTIAANSFSIAFADWQQFYLIVDRIGTRVLRDPFTNKPYVQFYTTKRVGGGVKNFEAGKLMKFATS